MYLGMLTTDLFWWHSVRVIVSGCTPTHAYLCLCLSVHLYIYLRVRLTLYPVPAHQTWRSSCSSRPSLPAARRSRTPAAHTSLSQRRALWCLDWLWSTKNSRGHILFSTHPSSECFCVRAEETHSFTCLRKYAKLCMCETADPQSTLS